MSITDFLFSLHKLLAWLFALLTVLLPQHLLGPLSAADIPGVPLAITQLCMQAPQPQRKPARAVLPPSSAEDASAAVNASDNSNPACPPRVKQ